ncbi:MAG: argininosuccinate lyase [Desulfomonilia bacterium]|nr:argininosuccinate lyase [Desulfomonilia bacterium]
MTDKPWSGRFRTQIHPEVERFTESVSIDYRLALQDIEVSIAHARMLISTGIITGEEASQIIGGLEEIRNEVVSGAFRFNPALEDVHMNIESELTQRIGEAGKKLHTARSRNDQVATDLRLFVREELERLKTELRTFMNIILERAEEHIDTIIPGMTHLQHAQPLSFAHHMLAYFEMFRRDLERIEQGEKRVNQCPLGSAALAGTPHPIDRFMTAGELGFSEPLRNSVDAVSDRDFAIETVFICAMIMMHLSRMAEEIILWNSQPFSFIELNDSYSTGSSIMPQKKNPDVAELVRGKVGSVYGHLISLLTTMKALPLAYNRDMQEDKRPIMDSLDTINRCLRVFCGLLESMELKKQEIERSLSGGFIMATDVADYLSGKGVPFRDAHRITGEMVSALIRDGKTFADLGIEEFRAYSPLFEPDVFTIITPAVSADRRTSYGGTASQRVREALREARAFLGDQGHET